MQERQRLYITGRTEDASFRSSVMAKPLSDSSNATESWRICSRSVYDPLSSFSVAGKASLYPTLRL